MPTSTNHTEVYVYCCHSKHTAASLRTLLSDLVCSLGVRERYVFSIIIPVVHVPIQDSSSETQENTSLKEQANMWERNVKHSKPKVIPLMLIRMSDNQNLDMQNEKFLFTVE
jgi:hypothetical protein